MCEPATLAIVATVAATASAGVAGYSAYQQSRYQSKVAKANASMEAERAVGEIDRGREERRNLARRNAAIRGEQTAAMAANGIDVDFGNAADVLGDTEQFYREDTATSLANERDRVRGIDINVANYRSEAAAAKARGTGQLIGTAFDMGGTILGGVGRVNRIRASQAGGGSGWSGY